MLRFLGLLLVVWLVITVAGAVIKGLFWLAVVGMIFFVATAAIGWNKRNDRALMIVRLKDRISLNDQVRSPFALARMGLEWMLAGKGPLTAGA